MESIETTQKCVKFGSCSYTARRQAGPSITAVIPSTVTTAESLAAYLESPLLYSFPANLSTGMPQPSQQTTVETDREGKDGTLNFW